MGPQHVSNYRAVIFFAPNVRVFRALGIIFDIFLKALKNIMRKKYRYESPSLNKNDF
jgi:hypothetical protein